MSKKSRPSKAELRKGYIPQSKKHGASTFPQSFAGFDIRADPSLRPDEMKFVHPSGRAESFFFGIDPASKDGDSTAYTMGSMQSGKLHIHEIWLDEMTEWPRGFEFSAGSTSSFDEALAKMRGWESAMHSKWVDIAAEEMAKEIQRIEDRIEEMHNPGLLIARPVQKDGKTVWRT